MDMALEASTDSAPTSRFRRHEGMRIGRNLMEVIDCSNCYRQGDAISSAMSKLGMQQWSMLL